MHKDHDDTDANDTT